MFFNLLLLPPCPPPLPAAWRGSASRVTTLPINPSRAPLALKMKPGPITATQAILLTSAGTSRHPHPSPALPPTPQPHIFIFIQIPQTAQASSHPKPLHSLCLASPSITYFDCLVPIHPSDHSSNATSSRKHTLTSLPTPLHTEFVTSLCLCLLT